MGGGDYRGRWRIASRCTVVNLMGGANLDLTGATIESANTEIRVFSLMRAYSVMGGTGVKVRATLGSSQPRLSKPPSAG